MEETREDISQLLGFHVKVWPKLKIHPRTLVVVCSLLSSPISLSHSSQKVLKTTTVKQTVAGFMSFSWAKSCPSYKGDKAMCLYTSASMDVLWSDLVRQSLICGRGRRLRDLLTYPHVTAIWLSCFWEFQLQFWMQPLSFMSVSCNCSFWRQCDHRLCIQSLHAFLMFVTRNMHLYKYLTKFNNGCII